MPIVNVQQVAILVIVVVAIILVFKFMKGCIKSVVCLFILIVGVALFLNLGGISDKTSGYLGDEIVYDVLVE